MQSRNVNSTYGTRTVQKGISAVTWILHVSYILRRMNRATSHRQMHRCMTLLLGTEDFKEVLRCNVSCAFVAKLLVIVAYVHLPSSRLLVLFAMSLSEFGALVK